MSTVPHYVCIVFKLTVGGCFQIYSPAGIFPLSIVLLLQYKSVEYSSQCSVWSRLGIVTFGIPLGFSGRHHLTWLLRNSYKMPAEEFRNARTPRYGVYRSSSTLVHQVSFGNHLGTKPNLHWNVCIGIVFGIPGNLALLGMTGASFEEGNRPDIDQTDRVVTVPSASIKIELLQCKW